MFVCQVAELEAQLGHPAAGETGGEELSQSVEELRALVSAKEQVRAAVPHLSAAVRLQVKRETCRVNYWYLNRDCNNFYFIFIYYYYFF